MELFGFYFSWIEISLFALLLITFGYQLYFYLRYISGVLRQNKRVKKDKIEFSPEQPPVSIIIAAKNEEDNLRQFLPLILQQDYPEFEVIVINDSSSDDTEFLCDRLKKEHSNFHSTFVPDGTKNISTKKLAITLGVKAAKYDLLLFTDADCYPQDRLWISRMVRNFTPQTDFVLGYGAYEKKKGFLNHLITYDTLFIGLQYMGMAIAGKPYMGVGRNLAYKKEVFFKEKGFSSHLQVLSGDDDLMVNKACNKNNCRVETSVESMTWSIPNKTFRNWYYQKVRHLSTSGYYKKSSRMRLGIEPLTRGLFYLSFILALIFGNLITLLASVFLFVLRLVMQLLIVNSSSRHFHGRRYLSSLLFADIFLPLFSLFIMITGKSRKKQVKWK